MAEEKIESVTYSKKELDSKVSHTIKTSFGVGVLMTGGILLFDKKVEKMTSWAIVVVGAGVIGMSFLWRWIERK